MTIPTQRVLELLLAEPEDERYGYEIGETAGLASGTVHPILARLEASAGSSHGGRTSTPAQPAVRHAATTGSPMTVARPPPGH